MQLVKSDNDILFTISREVSSEEIPELIKQYPVMLKFMVQNRGVGLAANQIGDVRRYFVWQYGMVINPKIVNRGKDVETMEEGCLSFPNRRVEVSRNRIIDVEYVDERNILVKKTLKGFPARVFQHEFDHLEGKCIGAF